MFLDGDASVSPVIPFHDDIAMFSCRSASSDRRMMIKIPHVLHELCSQRHTEAGVQFTAARRANARARRRCGRQEKSSGSADPELCEVIAVDNLIGLCPYLAQAVPSVQVLTRRCARAFAADSDRHRR
jgi:hypothetical protein